ncbi:hypothetical protein BDZ89DRAFT_1065044 [Hymenopellis radicata]|nr:hypothetical protein BDZ89DRAFT_1065044 [Hymenopellis radicata]
MPAGRPRGRKDGPRPPDAPPRGRPRKSASEPALTPDIDMDPSGEDDEFDFADSEWDDIRKNPPGYSGDNPTLISTILRKRTIFFKMQERVAISRAFLAPRSNLHAISHIPE